MTCQLQPLLVGSPPILHFNSTQEASAAWLSSWPSLYPTGMFPAAGANSSASFLLAQQHFPSVIWPGLQGLFFLTFIPTGIAYFSHLDWYIPTRTLPVLS